ncbi:MAG: pantothenate kinase [Gammaproteobacteria bacterium RIFCSPHIGHO2_12_FULL_38_14]|nr:MAG: pantothenate kinase [Gammaproteobacteria bacterium RIFCSPHIGHO2_12_FULL_38_14]
MLLCLDVGNTHILGGIFENNKLILRFRYATHLIGTADQFGIFLIQLLAANNIQPQNIKAISQASVVPGCDYTIRHTFSRYFLNAPYFELKAGVKTGLNIKYKNPAEVGADRIANAIGAVSAYPGQHIIIVDMGTATTLCAISNKKNYLGGAILPGMRLGMESLKNNTAKLMEVDIEPPESYVGRTTKSSIQSGLYYGQLGAIKEIISGFIEENFKNEDVTIIGTGGFSQLYKNKKIFNVILPDLVLFGLSKAFEYSTR